MIPKKIHYCWFGGKPIPDLVQKRIDSWKKFCPDYEIIEWNESNYDVTKCKYMHQAYEAKSWGFVPDYARLDILYEHGGVYFDTDVELIRPIDELLKNSAFAGFENKESVAFGLGFGAEAGLPILKQMMDLYEIMDFYGTFPSPYYQTLVLKEHGLVVNNHEQLVAGIRIYPIDYFCPMSFSTGRIRITKNTFSIHHYDMSWFSDEAKAVHLTAQKYRKFLPECMVGYIARIEVFLKLYGLTGMLKRAMQYLSSVCRHRTDSKKLKS